MNAFLVAWLLFAFAPAAQNVTGTWALNIVDKDGTHTQGYCTFRQDGSRLSGACGADKTGGAPLIGDITNGQLTWQVEEGPSYTAALDDRGTFMKGTFARSGEGIFTAMKTNL